MAFIGVVIPGAAKRQPGIQSLSKLSVIPECFYRESSTCVVDVVVVVSKQQSVEDPHLQPSGMTASFYDDLYFIVRLGH